MGYRTAELPPVDLDEFATIPFFERMKMLHAALGGARLRHAEADRQRSTCGRSSSTHCSG